MVEEGKDSKAFLEWACIQEARIAKVVAAARVWAEADCARLAAACAWIEQPSDKGMCVFDTACLACSEAARTFQAARDMLTPEYIQQIIDTVEAIKALASNRRGGKYNAIQPEQN